MVEPGAIAWNYNRAETLADGIIHGIGVCLALMAAVVLTIATTICATVVMLVAVLIYLSGLLSVLLLSASYNLWPVSRTKWLLRRFDHSAIYVLIAATYTPLILDAGNSSIAAWHLIGLWGAAAVGMLLKLRWPGRFDRTSIGLYLAMGWSGVALYRAEALVVPAHALWLIAAGGVLYTCGLIFHLWEQLRFQNAIWHCFVLAGAACHYAAIFDVVIG